MLPSPSSSSPTDKLAVETLDRIFELVEEQVAIQSYSKVLGRLSLVRKDWTALAQRRMLGHVYLEGAGQIRNAVAAIDRTGAGCLMRRAYLTLGPLGWKDQRLPEDEAAATLALEARAFGDLVNRCSGLKELWIHGAPSLHLHSPIGSAAFESLRSLDLTSCERHLGLGPTFDELRWLLARTPALESLHFTIHPEPDNADPWPESLPFPSFPAGLRHLRIGGLDPCVYLLGSGGAPLPPGSLQGLETLAVEGLDSFAEHLVVAMGPTLRTLQITSAWDSLQDLNHAFPHLKTLQELTFFLCDAAALAPPFSFASLPPSLKSLAFQVTPPDSFTRYLLTTPPTQQIPITTLSISQDLTQDLLGALPPLEVFKVEAEPSLEELIKWVEGGGMPSFKTLEVDRNGPSHEPEAEDLVQRLRSRLEPMGVKVVDIPIPRFISH